MDYLGEVRVEAGDGESDGTPVHPANTLIGPDGTVTVPDRSHFAATQRKVIERLADLGLV